MNLQQTWEQHRGRGCVKLDSFPLAQDRHLSRFRNTDARLLEIGVLAGGSLEIWQTYLGPDATVVGADIVPSVAETITEFTIHIGNQANPDFLQRTHDASGPFDIVIDDGGHTFKQQITSFETLYPLLADGGVYIVEDTCTSYWEEFDGGVGVAESFIEYAKHKVDEINADFIEAEAGSPRTFARNTVSVSFHQGMVVFEKQSNTPTKYLLCQDGALSLKGMQYHTGWIDEP